MFVIWGGFGQNGVHFGSDTRKRVEKEKGKRKKKGGRAVLGVCGAESGQSVSACNGRL